MPSKYKSQRKLENPRVVGRCVTPKAAGAVTLLPKPLLENLVWFSRLMPRLETPGSGLLPEKFF